ncbi:hypothetical protein R3W88_008059 [Solanum pinnatisectum]|uniref:Uncharacterized protein n=1 Tax=Solanum pinnatisectum TaxID=50273 RepID=A0AAV9M7K8_9SOLN|nr:hypothetical protein R3W88_008059 [Solanum pinnatisectum]
MGQPLGKPKGDSTNPLGDQTSPSPNSHSRNKNLPSPSEHGEHRTCPSVDHQLYHNTHPTELEDHMLSTTINPRQPGTLPSNTIKNSKNDGHCIAVTTRGGKQTIDPPMLYGVEIETSKDNDVVEVSGEFQNATEREVELTQKVSFKDDDRLQHCSAITTRSLVHKKEDPGAFTIPCTIGLLHFPKVLCDLGASINLTPLSIYKKVGLGDPKPNALRLLTTDGTLERPIGVLHDVLVDFEVPIILGRPFLATGRALVDMEKGKMKFTLNNEEETFSFYRSIK